MKKLLVFSGIVSSVLFFSQTTRSVGDFTLLKVYDRINVELIPSEENKVIISGNNDENIETINKNGELKIRTVTTKVLQGTAIGVKVYYDSLTDIQASQGSVIASSETVNSSLLSLTSNEGSKINLRINADKLNAKGNSGGEISVTGKASSQDIVMNSGAKFYGKNMESRNATATVNAGGFAEIFADNSVETTTRAGGKIEVHGDPDNRSNKKVAGGKVIFK